jgi:hypothetical protein
MPDWLVLLINLTIIWGLIWVMMNNSVTAKVNKLFVVLQASLGGVTLISASYTNYLIDMSDSMSFGIGLFGCIKLLQSLDDSWSRAKPGFRKIGLKHGAEQLLLLGWLDGKITYPDAIRLQRDIESVVGMPRLVRVDDLFAGESFVKSLCSNYKCILIHINPSLKNRVDSLINAACYADVVRLTHDLQAEWDTENKLFVLEVAPLILNLGSELLYQAWLESVEN